MIKVLFTTVELGAVIGKEACAGFAEHVEYETNPVKY